MCRCVCVCQYLYVCACVCCYACVKSKDESGEIVLTVCYPNRRFAAIFDCFTQNSDNTDWTLFY